MVHADKNSGIIFHYLTLELCIYCTLFLRAHEFLISISAHLTSRHPKIASIGSIKFKNTAFGSNFLHLSGRLGPLSTATARCQVQFTFHASKHFQTVKWPSWGWLACNMTCWMAMMGCQTLWCFTCKRKELETCTTKSICTMIFEFQLKSENFLNN